MRPFQAGLSHPDQTSSLIINLLFIRKSTRAQMILGLYHQRLCVRVCARMRVCESKWARERISRMLMARLTGPLFLFNLLRNVIVTYYLKFRLYHSLACSSSIVPHQLQNWVQASLLASWAGNNLILSTPTPLPPNHFPALPTSHIMQSEVFLLWDMLLPIYLLFFM